MTESIIVALITGAFALAGAVVTVRAGNKKTEKQVKEQGDLTIYRIDQLEKKVEKHNSVVERTFILEGEVRELQHEIKDIKRREE